MPPPERSGIPESLRRAGVWRITYDELPQPEQFASRVDLMEIDFDFRIERSAHRLEFV